MKYSVVLFGVGKVWYGSAKYCTVKARLGKLPHCLVTYCGGIVLCDALQYCNGKVLFGDGSPSLVSVWYR